MMKLTSWFKELNKEMAEIAGGKGASLGEMLNAKIPVPNGFVVLSDSFEEFLKETDLNVEIDAILHRVNHEDVNSVEQASEEIQSLILSRNMPQNIAKDIEENFSELDAKYVAVRSSATSEDSADAAWAGQLESYLNTTKKELLNNVKKCWASLFTPRAIFYRFEKGLHKTKISVAVVVQKMINSEISGIAFSVHPITQDYNQLIIEAGYGLGEAIVSGSITPDSYVVEKEPRRIIDINVADQEKGLFRIEGGGNEWKNTINGNKQKLSKKQIEELSEIILRIENHYGFPCDIEWAFEKGKFYIVQSRPITTLIKKETKNELINDEIDENIKSYLIDEKIPQDVPGFATYINLAALSTELMEKELGYSYERFLFKQEKETVQMNYFRDSVEKTWKSAEKYYLKDPKYFEKIEKRAKKEFYNLYNKFIRNYETLESINDKELHSAFIDAAELLKYGVGISHIIEAITFTQTHNLKDKLSYVIKDPKEMTNVMNIITTPKEISFINKFNNRTKEALLQKNKTKQKEMLENVVKDYYWITNGYSGKNNITIKEILKNKEKYLNSKETNLKNIEKKKESIIKKYKLDKETIELSKLLSFTTTWQDERKEMILRAIDEIAKIIEEIAKRKNIKKEYLGLLTQEEIINKTYLKKEFIKELKERKKFALYLYDAKSKPKHIVLSGKEAKNYYKKYSKNENNIETINGYCASTGKAIGEAQVCNNLKDIRNFKEGNILVASMTRPEYMPAIQKCRAIVTDEGGITCHAAIVSRELGIPCIIGTKNATKIIKNGDLIEVRANHGQVIFIEKHRQFKEKNDWFVVGKDFNSYLMRNDIWTSGVNNSGIAIKEFENYTNTLAIEGKNGNINYLVEKELWREMHNIFSKKIEENPKILKKIILDTNKIGDKALVKCKNFWKTNLKNKSDKYLLNKFRWLVQEQKKLYSYGMLMPLIDLGDKIYITNTLNKILLKKMERKKARKAFSILTEPKNESFLLENEKNLLKIAVQINKNKKTKQFFNDNLPEHIEKVIKLESKEIFKKIEKHFLEYFWINYVFSEPILNKKDFISQIKELINNNPEKKLEYIKQKRIKIEKERNSLIKKYAKTSFEKYLFELAGEFVWAKPRRKEYQAIIYACINEKILVEVAKRRKSKMEELLSYPVNDFEKLLKTNKRVNKNKIKSLLNHHIILPNKPKNTILTDKEANKYRKKITSHENGKTNNNIIKGNAAFLGNVKGTVKIINVPKDMQKINNGDILVSVATSPSIIPAMKKASAFVTDEGGLTCHAAIVSREMEKPCIVGTKNVTQILKDGDFVEVDANHGKVIVIKKNFKENNSIKLNYEPHKREYTLPFTSWVFEHLSKINPFGHKSNDSFIYIKNNDLYHCLSEEDYLGLAKAWLKKYGTISDLENQLKEFRKMLTDFDKFLNRKKFDDQKDIIYLYDYVAKTTPFFLLTTFLPNLDCNKKLKEKCTKLRVEFEEIHKKAVEPEQKILKRLEEINKLKKGTLGKITKDDFLKWIKTKKLPKYTNSKFILLKISNGQETIYTSKKYLEIFGLVEKVDENVNEITGISAFKGVVKGKVVLIKNKLDLPKVSVGDIIVAGMTDPSYLPAMKKASAFVTDEGGILCHAAIVAREMKKPCIIGTKVATKILKNGYFVEVDANNGKIKIFSNNSDKNQNSFDKFKKMIITDELDIKEAQCNTPVLDLVFTQYSKNNILGLKYNQIICTTNKTLMQQIFIKEDENKFEEKICNFAIKNKKRFLKILDEVKVIQLDIDNFSKSQLELSKLSDKEIYEYYKNFLKINRKWWKYGSIGENKGLIADKIGAIIQNNHKINEAQIDDFLINLTTSNKMSPYSKEKIAYFDLAIKIKKGEDYTKEIKMYNNNYFYSRTNFYKTIREGEEILIKIIKNEIKNVNLEYLIKEKNNLINTFEIAKKTKKEIEDKYNFSEEEENYLWYFRHIREWIDERRVHMSKQMHYFSSLLIEISKRKKINYDELSVYFNSELLELLKNNVKLSGEIINIRSKKSVYIFKDGKVIKFNKGHGELLHELINMTKLNELKGTIASKGNSGNIITGNVKIIHNPNHEKIKDEEILVTTMTRPEFIHIMKKARAIITNEGGLTSHAAIVSRELNTPCIIGTKHATRILKNGQKVELNLENGTIKILKKSSKEKVKNKMPIDYLIKYAKKYNIFRQAGKMSIFIIESFVRGVTDEEFDKYYGFNFGPFFCLIKNNHLHLSLDKTVYEKITNIAYKNYMKKGNKIKELVDYKKLRNNTIKNYQKMSPRKIKNMSDTEIKKELEKIPRQMGEILQYTIFTESLNAQMIREFHKEINSNKNKEEFVEISTLPAFESIITKNEKQLISNKEIYQKQWALTDYIGSPIFEELENEVKKEIRKKCGINNIKKDILKRHKMAKKNKQIIENYRKKLNQKEKKLFDFIQICLELRDTRKETKHKIFVIAVNLATEILKRNKINPKLYYYLTIDEILNINSKNKKELVNLANKRKKGVSFFVYKDIDTGFVLDDLKETEKKFNEFTDKKNKSNIIKGDIANKGKASGIVRVIHTQNEFKKFKEGNILVTSMTRPEFVHLMKKASAIITDEGGVTCHAAIVSRELNKPCIIGTKNATRILKDGMTVEVDANKGTIKILKKTN